MQKQSASSVVRMLTTKAEEQDRKLKHSELLQKYGLDVNTLISNEDSNSLHQDNDQKINFDIKDFNDTFYDLSENEKAIIMKLRIMNREKRTKIINEIFE